MVKCSAGNWRKRSTGSNGLAAAAADTRRPERARAQPIAAALETRAPRHRSARVDVCVPGSMRDARKQNAQNKRRNAEETCTDEEEPVGVEQRPSCREVLHPHAGESFRKLTDVGIRGAEQGVLRRRVAEAREARHVGDERNAGETDAEIVGSDD